MKNLRAVFLTAGQARVLSRALLLLLLFLLPSSSQEWILPADEEHNPIYVALAKGREKNNKWTAMSCLGDGNSISGSVREEWVREKETWKTCEKIVIKRRIFLPSLLSFGYEAVSNVVSKTFLIVCLPLRRELS